MVNTAATVQRRLAPGASGVIRRFTDNPSLGIGSAT
jgi:hypothetical protein